MYTLLLHYFKSSSLFTSNNLLKTLLSSQPNKQFTDMIYRSQDQITQTSKYLRKSDDPTGKSILFWDKMITMGSLETCNHF